MQKQFDCPNNQINSEMQNICGMQQMSQEMPFECLMQMLECSVQNDLAYKEKFNQNKSIETPRIFIGGVPPSMSTSELKQIFLASANTIENFPRDFEVVSVVCRKGFGFISLDNITEESIKSLIPKLHLRYKNTEFEVRLAVDKHTSKQNILNSRDRKLLIMNLTDSITSKKMSEYFSSFGEIEKAYVLNDPKTGKHRGFGFVTFTNIEDSNKVIAMKYHVINGTEVIAKKNKLKDEDNFIRKNFGFANNSNQHQDNGVSRNDQKAIDQREQLTEPKNIFNNCNFYNYDQSQDTTNNVNYPNQNYDGQYYNCQDPYQGTSYNNSDNYNNNSVNDLNQNCINYGSQNTSHNYDQTNFYNYQKQYGNHQNDEFYPQPYNCYENSQYNNQL